VLPKERSSRHKGCYPSGCVAGGHPRGNTYVDFDVTAAITGPGTYSFGLQSGSSNSVLFSSKEGGTPPELVVISSNGTIDFGPAFPGPAQNVRDDVFVPNSYSEDGFNVTPGSVHFHIYDRFQNNTTPPLPDGEREIQLHAGPAESIIITYSVLPTFSLLSLDVEVLDNGTAGWEVVSSSGAAQTITSVGTTILGPGFRDVTSVTVRRTPGEGGGLWIDDLRFAVCSDSDVCGLNVPEITGFNPISGQVGSQVTITGQNFQTEPATDVTFNGVSVGGAFTITNDTTILATVPVGAHLGPIAVTNADGPGASVTNFTVEEPPVNGTAASSFTVDSRHRCRPVL